MLEILGLQTTIIISIIFLLIIAIPCIKAIQGVLAYIKTGNKKLLYKTIYHGTIVLLACSILNMTDFLIKIV